MRRFRALLTVAAVIATILIAAPKAEACNGGCSDDNFQWIASFPSAPYTYGQDVAVSGRFRDQSTECVFTPGAGNGCDEPTGTVEYYNQGQLLDSGDVRPMGFPEGDTSEWGTLHHSGLPAGNYTLRVQYVPGNFTSDSRTFPVHVDLAPSVVNQLTVSPTTSVAGQSVQLSARVAPATPSAIDFAHGAVRPDGGIEFLVDGSSIASQSVVQSTGVATFNWPFLPVGTHSLTARYLTDGKYDTSPNFGPVSFTVNKANSVSTLTQSAATTVFGQPFTLTDTVAAVSPSSGTPTGTATFRDGLTPLGVPVALNGVGTAQFISSTLPAGTHTLNAAFSGDPDFNSSNSNLVDHTVNKASTAITLGSTVPGTSTLGQSVTFFSTLSVVAPGAGTPTGSVQYYDGNKTLGAPVPLSGTNASLTTSSLTPGVHQITAVYLGDANFNSSTSPAVTQTVPCDTTVGYVAGSMTVSSTGTTCFVDASVGSNVTIPAGAHVAFIRTSIGNNLTSDGAATVFLCGTSVGGALKISNTSGALHVGDPGASCGDNSVTGVAQLNGNHGGVGFYRTTVGGNTQVSANNGGAITIGGNTITAALSCVGNNPAPTNGGIANTVTGTRSGQCSSATF